MATKRKHLAKTPRSRNRQYWVECKVPIEYQKVTAAMFERLRQYDLVEAGVPTRTQSCSEKRKAEVLPPVCAQASQITLGKLLDDGQGLGESESASKLEARIKSLEGAACTF